MLLLGGYCELIIGFVADPDLVDGDADDVDPADAPYLRLRDMRPAAEVGTRFLSLGQLAHVSRAGRGLLTLDADNTVLAEAVEALETAILAGLEPDRDGCSPRPLSSALLALARCQMDSSFHAAS